MAKEWLYLQNELQAVRTFCNSHPIFGLLIFLTIAIYIVLIFNFIFNEKVLPTKVGGLPLEYFWVRMIAGGIFVYSTLKIFFQQSVLLKLFFVIPIMTLGWLIYKDYDD